MKSLFKNYQRFIHSYPIVSQSIQTGILCGVGDVIAQTYVEDKPLKELDYIRTAHFALVGSALVGPALTVWYRFLSKTLPSSVNGKQQKSAVFKKVAMDQLLFAPTFLPVFIGAINLISGKTIKESKEEIKNKYFDILMTNYKIWPCVQLGNFYFVPLEYQVLLVQIVAILWNAYLSHKTAN